MPRSTGPKNTKHPPLKRTWLPNEKRYAQWRVPEGEEWSGFLFLRRFFVVVVGRDDASDCRADKKWNHPTVKIIIKPNRLQVIEEFNLFSENKERRK